jgi:hypothetical protein
VIFAADAHRGDGKRFVVHADEKVAMPESPDVAPLYAILYADHAILELFSTFGNCPSFSSHR